ncbi:MAG: glycosyltransferase family 4 protein, partial [Sedimentisphaerales bacterium]|nr:glycosyltransferase family 4 protein [Sedimentisphaerales bacterium]
TTISMLRGEEGYQNKELDRLTTWLAQKERPDVVCLSNVLLAGMARRIRQVLDVPIVCLLEDEDEFLDALPESKRDEAWELLVQRAADIDMFIAVSQYFAQVMQKRLRLKAERLRVVRPGIPKDDFTPADQPPSLPTIGYLSRMCRDKGLDVLVEAFIILKQNERLKDIRLCAAGGKTAYDDPYLDKIRSRLNSSGFMDSVEFLEKYHFADRYSFLRGLTVLSVPEKQAPAYGLYALESLAMGVPIVQPPSGVFPELQQEIPDGITLTKSNDPEAFAAALEPLLLDPDAARERGLRGRKKVLEKFNLNKTCSEMIEVFQLSAKLSQS